MLELIEDVPVLASEKVEEAQMGKVVGELELLNAGDEEMVRRGHMKASEIRRIRIPALVDTGATGLSVSEEYIQKLGLPVIREVTSQFANGQTAMRKVYGAVTLNIMGRSAITWVVAGAKNVPALMGQIPLEQLDLMVDPRNQRLVPGHPESPDVAVYESY